MKTASLRCLLASCDSLRSFWEARRTWVGPKYVRPSKLLRFPMTTPAFKEPVPEGFKETPKDWGRSTFTRTAPSTFRRPWWELFGDAQLNALEPQVATENQDLKVAEARFRQARAMIRVNRSAEFPTISTGPGGISSTRVREIPAHIFRCRRRLPGDLILPFDFSYEVDLWGRVRRRPSIASCVKKRRPPRPDHARPPTPQHSGKNLLSIHFDLRAADAQKRLVSDRHRHAHYAGRASSPRTGPKVGPPPSPTWQQAQTQLDTARLAQDTDIGVDRAQYRACHRHLASRQKPPAAFELVSGPADSGAAHADSGGSAVGASWSAARTSPPQSVAPLEANEQIGIARAAFFPTVTLGGSGGRRRHFHSQLVHLAEPVSGPSVHSAAQTLFDAGRRRATSDAALAGYDATVASYREATLTAFQQVEDNRAALRILEQEEAQQRDAPLSSRAGIAAAIHQSLPGRRRQLSSSDYGANHGAPERTQRNRYPAASHGRERSPHQSPGRRLESRPDLPKVS